MLTVFISRQLIYLSIEDISKKISQLVLSEYMFQWEYFDLSVTIFKRLLNVVNVAESTESVLHIEI